MVKILVIEDDLALLQELAEILTFEGYEPIAAADGRTGVAAAMSNLPDLIICDLQMPYMNGYEVLQQLRAHPATHHIPLIVVTATVEQYAMEIALNFGANAYMTKPFILDDLLATVQLHLT